MPRGILKFLDLDRVPWPYIPGQPFTAVQETLRGFEVGDHKYTFPQMGAQHKNDTGVMVYPEKMRHFVPPVYDGHLLPRRRVVSKYVV